MKKSTALFSTLFCAIAPLPAAFGQGMMGTTLHYGYIYPNAGTELESDAGPANYTITSAVEIPSEWDLFRIDVTDSQIILTMTSDASWSHASFNGVQWSDLTNNLGAISSVTVDAATNYPDFAPWRVSFNADSVSINMRDLQPANGHSVVLNVVTTPTPGSAALLGLGGLAATRRRRRR